MKNPTVGQKRPTGWRAGSASYWYREGWCRFGAHALGLSRSAALLHGAAGWVCLGPVAASVGQPLQYSTRKVGLSSGRWFRWSYGRVVATLA